MEENKDIIVENTEKEEEKVNDIPIETLFKYLVKEKGTSN